MSSFDDSFIQPGDDDSVHVESVPLTQPLDYEDDYNNQKNVDDDVFVSQSSNENGLGGSDGPILPAPSEMLTEVGVVLREWRRENALRLEEKEKREKELLSQIIDEADGYKAEFYRKREITSENSKLANRDKEKMFVSSQDKFYAEADKDYWKTISELIPNEVATIENRAKKKKDDEKKPSIIVVHGPKPGKPTELSRMRHILIKLKHNTPTHLKFAPKPATGPSTSAAKAAVVIPEPVAAA
jgi:hypothetical protein